MEKTFAGVTYEYAKDNLQWVVKHDSWREVVTGAELDARGEWWEDDTIRDVDIAGRQTDPIMQRFCEEWEKMNKEHGWMTMWELFDKCAE